MIWRWLPFGRGIPPHLCLLVDTDMSAESKIFSYPQVGRPITPSNEIARSLISIMAQRAGSRTAYTQAHGIISKSVLPNALKSSHNRLARETSYP